MPVTNFKLKIVSVLVSSVMAFLFSTLHWFPGLKLFVAKDVVVVVVYLRLINTKSMMKLCI